MVPDRLAPALARLDHHRDCPVIEGSDHSLAGLGIDQVVVVFDHRNHRCRVVLVNPSVVGNRCKVPASTMRLPRGGIQK